MDKDKELNNCYFIKTVLMILVVIGHSLCFWGGNWFTANPDSIVLPFIVFANWLNSFHIYGFALVSGYIFFFIKHEKERYSKFVPFIINKAKRLLIPYIFISLFWVIPLSYLFFEFRWSDIILKYILGTAPSQLWFLLMLFFVFIIFYPLSNFFKNHTVYGAISVVIIYGIGLIGQALFANIFQFFTACCYIPLFWLGFKIRQYGSSWLRKIPILIWLIVDIILFVLTQYLAKSDSLIFKLLTWGFDFVLHIVGSLMAFVILQKIADLTKWKQSKSFGFLSKNSMPVYLLHQQIIYVSIYLFNGILNPYIHATVNFLCAMIISLFISFIMMKFKGTRFLLGEK